VVDRAVIWGVAHAHFIGRVSVDRRFRRAGRSCIRLVFVYWAMVFRIMKFQVCGCDISIAADPTHSFLGVVAGHYVRCAAVLLVMSQLRLREAAHKTNSQQEEITNRRMNEQVKFAK